MKPLFRVTIAASAALAIVVVTPLAAAAHVTIDPSSAEPGAYTVVTVKVPNESATASTSAVELRLPADTPFASVRYVPVPGWTVAMTTEQLPEPATVGEREISEAVTSVVWTASPGAEIGDGQLQQFELSLGPVPDVDAITFPAIQTYTDGDVVEWIEEGEDSERPAPVLDIAATSTDDDGQTDEGSPSSGAAASGTTAMRSDDVVARTLGAGGLVLGAIALVLALVRRRSVTNK